MHYEGHIIRPPSEADSIILQVTVGCSHNRCTFCGAYKDQRFRIKNDWIIDEDIAYAAEHFHNHRRIFLCDGDAMIMPHGRLLRILRRIKEELPRVTRVGIYANAKSLQRKTLKQLEEMKAMGLGIIYLGLESGDNDTLHRVNKKGNSEEIVFQGCKVKKARIKLSVTVLLGIAGTERSVIHARETGRALSDMNPEFVGALTLMLIPGSPLYQEWKKGTFILPDPQAMLLELREMIVSTHLDRGLFMANHASNYLPIRARMPKDKEAVIQLLDDALAGNVPLRPDWMRTL
jgi:radical SAM superfamily enzyme YgiQ (UPF0313 family)